MRETLMVTGGQFQSVGIEGGGPESPEVQSTMYVRLCSLLSRTRIHRTKFHKMASLHRAFFRCKWNALSSPYLKGNSPPCQMKLQRTNCRNYGAVHAPSLEPILALRRTLAQLRNAGKRFKSGGGEPHSEPPLLLHSLRSNWRWISNSLCLWPWRSAKFLLHC